MRASVSSSFTGSGAAGTNSPLCAACGFTGFTPIHTCTTGAGGGCASRSSCSSFRNALESSEGTGSRSVRSCVARFSSFEPQAQFVGGQRRAWPGAWRGRSAGAPAGTPAAPAVPRDSPARSRLRSAAALRAAPACAPPRRAPVRAGAALPARAVRRCPAAAARPDPGSRRMPQRSRVSCNSGEGASSDSGSVPRNLASSP